MEWGGGGGRRWSEGAVERGGPEAGVALGPERVLVRLGGPTRRVFAEEAVAEIADQPPGAGRLDALRRGLIGARLLVIGPDGNDDKGADEEVR